MQTRRSEDEDRELEREIQRYRRAALEALNQLEWCVDYLYAQRRAQIARVISHNRHKIIERAGL